MRLVATLTFSLSLACPGFAQVANEVGFTFSMPFSATSRLGANAIAADGLHHFDSRHYRDWMLDPTDPTGSTYTFRAVRFTLQDEVANTAETCSVVGYREDPATPNFPNIAAPWFRTGPLNLPTMPSGAPQAWILTVTMPTSLPSIPKGSVWIGVGLSTPVSGTWPADGTSLHCNVDQTAGPAITNLANNQVSCYVPTVAGVPSGPAVYPTSTVGGRQQIRLEIIANVTGGVCLSRNGLLPQTNFLSGLHPDVYNGTGATPPRQDDIGFVVREDNQPNGLVIVVVALGQNPLGSQPLAAVSPFAASPNTRGNVCIDLNQGTVFLGMMVGNGIFQQMLPLTPQVRATIQSLSSATQPLDLWYQAFVLDPTASGPPYEIHATGCGVQHL